MLCAKIILIDRMENKQFFRHLLSIGALGGTGGATVSMFLDGNIDPTRVAIALVGVGAGALGYKLSLDNVDPLVRYDIEIHAPDDHSSFRI